MQVSILNQEKEKVGSLSLDNAIWQIPYSAHVVSLIIRSYLANQRQGTSKVKTRGEVKGSTRKIYRQKGTGGARHGSRYAPQFYGGGRAHGPSGEENHQLQANKKVKRKAFQMILNKKLENNEITIVEGLELKEYKTKQANNALTSLGIRELKTLIILSVQESKNEGIKRAFQNLPKVELANSQTINAYKAMYHPVLLFTKAAFSELEQRLSSV